MNVYDGKTRTNAEQKLAKALRKRKIQFKQNQVIEGYEVDFWFWEVGLVVEVDGFSHLSNVRQLTDRNKDRKLIEKGYSILRFENRQIHDNLASCVSEIESLYFKLKTFRKKRPDSINSKWKKDLEPVKKLLPKPSAKIKTIKSIEEHFLSLEDESE